MQKFRSPLAYVGSKYAFIDTVQACIPEETTHLMSPFFGGGSIELNLAYHQSIKVHAYDICPYLITFWQFFIESPDRVIKTARDIAINTPHETLKTRKKTFVREFPERTLETAALYYLFNKLSYKGITITGNTVLPYQVSDGCLVMKDGRKKLTEKHWEYAERIDIAFERKSFEKSLIEDTHLAIIDPPYVGSETRYIQDNNTASRGIFDHHLLSTILKWREKWILFYNHCPQIPYVKLAYKGYYHCEVKRNSAFAVGPSRELSHLIIFSEDIAARIKDKMAISRITESP